MRTNGSVHIKDYTVVFCEGDEINAQTRCARFEVQGRIYDAIGSSVSNSFSDILQLGILLRGNVDVPEGEVTILK